MSNPVKLSYERLKQEVSFEDDDSERVIARYLKLRESQRGFFRRLHVKRRPRVKIPSLRRFLSKKARALKASWLKVCKRLKESQAHFGDIFAGNYMFMQVTPTPLKSSVDYTRDKHLAYLKDRSVSGLPSTRFSLAA